ncbi:redox-sensitive transcriptional activator SoxR [Pseudomonas sp. CFBP 13602]|uniref:redox-sensitive transcriptional activator SoxR n=1 Tax=Pseudomonas sp. CFBP 13602 TaxID=2774039 RepID=UPI001786740E|nr:redox-sensitive transcriptional activator SoxR [Pseudomonas sp. CFBP 13602]MBD8826095.1 redox-sensitive transcriptional activator SoxR [Pseudomonas sp. CFBP 13602]
MVKSLRMLTVGEVARRAGVAVSALHFYEKKGLIASVRTSGNQRQFPAHVLRYVAVIKVAQRAGFSLKEIKQALDAYPSDSKLTTGQWRNISSRWRDNFNERILMLTRLRDELDGCIGCGCLSLVDCPLRNPADKFGQVGPGAGLLERD